MSTPVKSKTLISSSAYSALPNTKKSSEEFSKPKLDSKDQWEEQHIQPKAPLTSQLLKPTSRVISKKARRNTKKARKDAIAKFQSLLSKSEITVEQTEKVIKRFGDLKLLEKPIGTFNDTPLLLALLNSKFTMARALLEAGAQFP